MKPLRSLFACAFVFIAVAAHSGTRCIHVFTSLADNRHQGIVPVPEKLGNGDDPDNNLYWGALYGVRTYFRKSPDWEVLATSSNPTAGVLERCVFKHKTADVLLVADAYKGSEIKRAVSDFLIAAGGGNAGELQLSGKEAGTYGGADIVVYVGHNGLMDFAIQQDAIQHQQSGRAAIVLACQSKQYFLPWLTRLKARPVLLTTGLMAPEAYSLKAALDAWISGSTGEQVKEAAAAAYNKYQKCGIRGARGLFYSED